MRGIMLIGLLVFCLILQAKSDGIYCYDCENCDDEPDDSLLRWCSIDPEPTPEIGTIIPTAAPTAPTPGSTSSTSVSTAQPTTTSSTSASTAQPTTTSSTTISTAQPTTTSSTSISTAQPTTTSSTSISTAQSITIPTAESTQPTLEPTALTIPTSESTSSTLISTVKPTGSQPAKTTKSPESVLLVVAEPTDQRNPKILKPDLADTSTILAPHISKRDIFKAASRRPFHYRIQTRAVGDLSYHCFKLTIRNDSENLIVKRGCVAVTEEDSACDILAADNGNVEKCSICTTDRCNSGTNAHLSSLFIGLIGLVTFSNKAFW